jgi:hypothetical protein
MKLQQRLGLIAFPLLAATAGAQSQLDWLASYDGPLQAIDSSTACATDSNGAVYVAGATQATAGTPIHYDATLAKFSAAGALVWSNQYDLVGLDETLADIAISPSGDIYATGRAVNANSAELLLLKYSSTALCCGRAASTVRATCRKPDGGWPSIRTAT